MSDPSLVKIVAATAASVAYCWGASVALPHFLPDDPYLMFLTLAVAFVVMPGVLWVLAAKLVKLL